MRIYPISPAFRVVAVALPPSVSLSAVTGGTPWLIDELLPLFSFHVLPAIGDAATEAVLQRLFPQVPEQVCRPAPRLADSNRSLCLCGAGCRFCGSCWAWRRG
jgi:hypothetical protein